MLAYFILTLVSLLKIGVFGVVFDYSGVYQTYTVPYGVIEIIVELYGAQGGLNDASTGGGKGGKITTESFAVSMEIYFIFMSAAKALSLLPPQVSMEVEQLVLVLFVLHQAVEHE